MDFLFDYILVPFVENLLCQRGFQKAIWKTYTYIYWIIYIGAVPSVRGVKKVQIYISLPFATNLRQKTSWRIIAH